MSVCKADSRLLNAREELSNNCLLLPVDVPPSGLEKQGMGWKSGGEMVTILDILLSVLSLLLCSPCSFPTEMGIPANLLPDVTGPVS